jgi:TfoX/Sxy family transcriptional regulator of competence genes
MPSFEPAPAALIDRFDTVAARTPDVQRRKMFGYPALFVGGNLVSGLFADRWMVRLGSDDLAELLQLPGAEPFSPMPGRTMRGYGVLPRELVDDDDALDAWLARAITLGRSLPAK